jgi:hypothetical protein
VQRIGWHAKRIVTTPKDVTRADYDLEAAIKNTFETLRTKKKFIKEKHVRGHKDRHTDYNNLQREEQLNVQADHEATKKATQRPGGSRSDKSVPGTLKIG